MVPLACCLSIAGRFHYLFSGLYIFVTTHADVFLELFFLFIFYVMLFDFVYWNLQLNWHTLLIILHALLGYVYGMYFFFCFFFVIVVLYKKKKLHSRQTTRYTDDIHISELSYLPKDWYFSPSCPEIYTALPTSTSLSGGAGNGSFLWDTV